MALLSHGVSGGGHQLALASPPRPSAAELAREAVVGLVILALGLGAYLVSAGFTKDWARLRPGPEDDRSARLLKRANLAVILLLGILIGAVLLSRFPGR